MLFFQLMTRRYEHAATVLTSNKGFEEWGDIFGTRTQYARDYEPVTNFAKSVTAPMVGDHGAPVAG
jgi:hypothetical protein